LFIKILFRVLLLASMKTLTNSGDFTGSHIRISLLHSHPPNETGGNSKGIVNLNSSVEKADRK
jgi:hypothetical protein